MPLFWLPRDQERHDKYEAQLRQLGFALRHIDHMEKELVTLQPYQPRFHKLITRIAHVRKVMPTL